MERESFRSRCAQRSVENGSGDFEDRRKDVRGFAAIGLDNPKFDANFGGVMRAAGCYGAAMVAISGGRMRHVATDTGKMWRSVQVIETEDLHSVIPFDCVTVAVDLIPGARSLVGYAHPERAFYIFGAEDETLGESVVSWCRDVVYVPSRFCMNLAATANVILYDRMAKMGGKAANDRFHLATKDARETA